VKTVLHWFRRDLRVGDNTALSEASRRAARVVPVFLFEADDLEIGAGAGEFRSAYRRQSLEVLRNALAGLGCPLVIRRGRAEDVLPRLCLEVGAEAVFANKVYEPELEARDRRVGDALNAAGLGAEWHKDAVIREEEEILTQAGRPFTVFTPYARAWRRKAIPPPRSTPPALGTGRAGHGLASDSLPRESDTETRRWSSLLPPAGELAARAVLGEFLRGPVYEYAESRDFPAIEGTSRLSPHLSCGTIGVRTILAALRRARAAAETPAQRRGCDVFLQELIWREFYVQVLHHFPHVATGPFRGEYARIRWSANRERFQAWCEGATGYPLVDAAMRCLNRTGWLHNRLRMVVAMFLTKDLLIDWRWGERYFMQRLVDGDLAANSGGWQWSAGTGTDAAPYFRIFNPVLQGEKFDPGGAFVRRWVPELEGVPDRLVHRPWEAPASARSARYGARLIRHEDQREKCLELFRAARRGRGAAAGGRVS
jgi:deoxyribodipyrimidine photo-lyase